MSYIRGEDRGQAALLPSPIEDYVRADAPVRVIDAFVEGLDVRGLGFGRSEPAATGRPPYDPRDLLKLYIYGYLNEVRSSRRLDVEPQDVVLGQTEATDGSLIIDTGMRPMPVVSVQPGRQLSFSFA